MADIKPALLRAKRLEQARGHQCISLPRSAVKKGGRKGRERRWNKRRILTMILNRARLLFMLQLIRKAGWHQER